MAAEIEVGHAVFALHEPNPGRERDFNRWYEREHMYIGGILAPWTIGASRWVATAALKRQRFGSGAFGPIACGSYFTAYWIQQGRLADQQKWVSEQLAGEMATRFDDKSVQTATTYDRVGSWQRDSDGVPPYLALAHHYPGLVWLVLQRADNRDIADLANWLFDDYADRYWTKSVVASAVAFSPRPKEPWWPPAAPEVDGVGERLMVACFLEEDPSRSWDRLFAPLQEAITSVGEALFAGPFIPTVVGTDRHCDALHP